MAGFEVTLHGRFWVITEALPDDSGSSALEMTKPADLKSAG